MAFHLEACRTHLADAGQTAFHVIDLTASLAMEVVVMIQVGSFVARGLPGHINGNDVAFLDQTLKSTIDGGDAQARNVGLGFG